jgi:hypothetical protein
MVSYKTCVVVSKEGVSILYMDFNYLLLILKKGGQIGGVMVFTATFNNISVISWLSCFIGGVCQENH